MGIICGEASQLMLFNQFESQFYRPRVRVGRQHFTEEVRYACRCENAEQKSNVAHTTGIVRQERVQYSFWNVQKRRRQKAPETGICLLYTSIQISYQQHPKQHFRLYCWSPIVCAVQRCAQLVYEAEVHCVFHFAQKVLLRHQLFQYHYCLLYTSLADCDLSLFFTGRALAGGCGGSLCPENFYVIHAGAA